MCIRLTYLIGISVCVSLQQSKTRRIISHVHHKSLRLKWSVQWWLHKLKMGGLCNIKIWEIKPVDYCQLIGFTAKNSLLSFKIKWTSFLKDLDKIFPFGYACYNKTLCQQSILFVKTLLWYIAYNHKNRDI